MTEAPSLRASSGERNQEGSIARDEKIAEARRLRETGWSCNEIAVRFDVHPVTAWRWITGYKEPRRLYPLRKCPICGKDFRPSDRLVRHCSRSCGNSREVIGFASGWGQAQRLYPLQGRVCEGCGVAATERHHRDGNPTNNIPENIAFVCHRCHMEMDGRLQRLRGRHGPPKLTWEIVREIRTSTESQKDIARQLGVDPSTISVIQSGKRWRE
jgi:transposase-like protein